MHRSRPFRPATLVLAALALLTLPATALADSEPNNGLLEAEGPLAGGTAYTGQSATDNDVDWYTFYASSQVELDIDVTAPDDCDGRAELRDANGEFIASAYAEMNSVDDIRHTTPQGTNRFYLTAACNTGAHYRFTINPAGGITSGPSAFGPPVPTGEPNESRAQAIGPLLGGTDYAGVQGTDNDTDWFYFYAFGNRALDIAVAAPDDCDGTLSLLDASGDEKSSASASQNSVNHLQYTTPAGVKKFFLNAHCDNTGGHYQFRIDPADAVTSQPPSAAPGPSAKCVAAKRRRSTYGKRVRRLKIRVARAQTSRKWRRAKRKLRRARSGLKRSKVAVRTYCV